MTQRELDNAKYTIKCCMEEQFKSMQSYSYSLKDPDDEQKNKITMSKIKDIVANVDRLYLELEELNVSNVDEEDNNDFEYGYGYKLDNNF